MKDLLFHHPSEEVRAAAVRLCDALCSWERTTGRHHVLILKDSIGVEIRILDNAPQLEWITDADLLEAFGNLAKEERR